MTEKNSLPEDKTESVLETTQADEQDAESKADISAPLPVVSPPEAEKPEPDESYDETDRKQDEAIDSLAEQTSWIAQQTGWMEKQTKWVRAQTIASFFLGVVTLGVLVYHGVLMNRQSQAARDQTNIMKGQLESMNSSSQQTQDLIEATRETANASQSVAEQNKELVKHAGDQAKASLAQVEAAKQSVGAAQSAARAAEKGAQIAQQSFYIGDRPYVSAINASIDTLEAGMKPRVVIHLTNAGKTPALEFKLGAIVSVGRLPEPPDPESVVLGPSDLVYPFGSEASSLFLAADEKLSMKAQGLEILNEATVEEIKSGKLFLFVWGAASYEDGLGKPHGLLFCMFYEPDDEEFVACPTFNKTK